MIEFTKTEKDDEDFISKAQTLSNKLVSKWRPSEVFLLKIDNWFDSKWLNFTGKVLGELGTWNLNDDARIPPFSVNRLIEQQYFKINEFRSYSREKSVFQIHEKQPAEANLQRRIVDISESAVFIWYSSNTKINGHGSLMFYPVVDYTCQPFYVGFKKIKTWEIVSAPGSSKKELESYLKEG